MWNSPERQKKLIIALSKYGKGKSRTTEEFKQSNKGTWRPIVQNTDHKKHADILCTNAIKVVKCWNTSISLQINTNNNTYFYEHFTIIISIQMLLMFILNSGKFTVYWKNKRFSTQPPLQLREVEKIKTICNLHH